MNKSRILDPEFKYVPSFKTNIRDTMERVRKEQQHQAARKVLEKVVALNAPGKIR